MTYKYTPEKVAELVAEAREGDFPCQECGMNGVLADALTAVSAELRQERERAEGHKAAFLVASSERFEAIKARDIFHAKAKDATYAMNEAQDDLRADRDRLHKAITEALAFESVLPAIATEPRRILRAALDQEGQTK